MKLVKKDPSKEDKPLPISLELLYDPCKHDINKPTTTNKNCIPNENIFLAFQTVDRNAVNASKKELCAKTIMIARNGALYTTIPWAAVKAIVEAVVE